MIEGYGCAPEPAGASRGWWAGARGQPFEHKGPARYVVIPEVVEALVSGDYLLRVVVKDMRDYKADARSFG